ncbi:MAG: RNA methyltransferase [Vitreoscilla sp.]|nr:RNA methyltransferase [Vitreoscilla sp.]MBP9541665.1 RNA methyltransferase [Vitreoscilla sp.]
MEKPQLPDFLQNITVVLARTSHPANIGSAARAMKTMGLTQLVLVAPNLIATPMTPVAPEFNVEAVSEFSLPEESFVLASGAKDVLENARIVATLQEALADTTMSCALTSRKRELTATMHTPRELCPSLIDAARRGEKVALVFGNETFGLSIEEVMACNRLMTINGNPNYFSLNLAQAVQVVCYELFSHVDVSMDYLRPEHEYATHEQVSGMVRHLQAAMGSVGFFDRRPPERLMRRMQAVFDRAQLEREEIDILRGFFHNIEKQVKKD